MASTVPSLSLRPVVILWGTSDSHVGTKIGWGTSISKNNGRNAGQHSGPFVV